MVEGETFHGDLIGCNWTMARAMRCDSRFKHVCSVFLCRCGLRLVGQLTDGLMPSC